MAEGRVPGEGKRTRWLMLAAVGVLVAGAVFKVTRYALATRFEARRAALFAAYAPYDLHSEPQEDVRSARAAAQNGGRQVLAVLGGNWCPWCLALEDLLHTDRDFARWLEERFQRVHVDSTRGRALDRAWGEPSRDGVPALVVLGRQAPRFTVVRPDGCRVLGAWVLGYDADCLRAALTEAAE